MRNIKTYFSATVAYLTALLFIYAATSKLLDFQNFEVQLGQSPLISAFASWVAILVPAIEYVIAIILFMPKFRSAALFASFTLMTMFTVYIYMILNYSSFVPCSCGGVLEKMTWRQHMFFNLAFVIAIIVAVLITPVTENASAKQKSSL